MGEIIEKNINAFETYTINTQGIVKCIRTGKILPQFLNSSGYKTVNIKNPNGCRTYTIHRLVGEMFLPKSNEKLEIDHIDRNKLNNNLDNLRWVDDYEQAINKKSWSESKKKYIYYEDEDKKNYASFTIRIKNHKLKYCKRFRTDMYSFEDVVKHRNHILSVNNIEIID